MPTKITPKQLQRQVHIGVDRLQNFRSSRVHFISEYAGKYYDKPAAEVGTKPLNLLFNAIRNIVPSIVMQAPQHKVSTPYLDNSDYAELMALALSFHDKQINIEEIYRQAIVDAFFAIGVLKTGIAASDTVYAIDEYDNIDSGSVYTECVSFDNLVVDPKSVKHKFADARFIGDRITAPRQTLLDSGLYNNELIERLPSMSETMNGMGNGRRSQDLSMGKDMDEVYDATDEVEVIELWVPEAEAIITVPGHKDVVYDDYLRLDEYVGPAEGPYTFLALTPPVPDNPMPASAVSQLYDLHVLANRMAKKIVDQAERQKDIYTYRSNGADDAEAMRDAADGEGVRVDDPDAVKVISLGGQNQSNEAHLAQLQGWFNVMASNPQGAAQQNVGTATEAAVIQQNANVGIEDLRHQIYMMSQQEARKRAYYFHTDPFISMPLVRQRELPSLVSPVTGELLVSKEELQEQVELTPEIRRGEWLDYHFTIVPESMKKKTGDVEYAEMMEFATQVAPAVFQMGMVAQQMQMPFNPQAMLNEIAKTRGYTWFSKVWSDPEFAQRLHMMAMSGPQAKDSKPQPTANGGLAAILQNGQPGQVGGGVDSRQTLGMQNAQAGAAEAQSLMKRGLL